MASTSKVQIETPGVIERVGSGAQHGLARIRRTLDHLLGGELSDDQRVSLTRVEESVVALQSLMSDVLDLSAVDEGKLVPASTTFNIADTLREAVRTVRPLADGRGLELSVVGLRTLPSALIGDPGRLRQIVQHLLKNAIEATATGVVSLTTAVAADQESGTRIRFEVWDTGTGIDESDLERIFQPFERSLAGGADGAGLGLTVADRLVTVLGGALQVQSRPDTGSVFSFELDFVKPEAAPEPPTIKTGPAWIVVISDVVGPNDRVTTVLERLGHAVTVHASPELASASLGLTEADPPDVLVLAPGSRPMDVAARVARDPLLTRVPTIIVSPDGLRGEGARCEALGIDAYLAQPLSPVDLAETITLLRSRPRRGGSLVTRHLLRERRGSLKILLVDGSPTRRASIMRQLEPLGHRVEVAPTGSIGLAEVTKGGFDAVVIDDEVGELDCLALVRAIRRWETAAASRLTIVATTQLGNALDERRYRAAGFDACMPRSSAIERLHAALRTSVPTR